MDKAKQLLSKMSIYQDLEDMRENISDEDRQGILGLVYGKQSKKLDSSGILKKRIKKGIGGFVRNIEGVDGAKAGLKSTTSPAIAKTASALIKKGKKSQEKIINTPCIDGLKDKGFSCGKRGSGFVIYTHRASSKTYPSLEKIPTSEIDRIASTS
jgi:hypothetical protein